MIAHCSLLSSDGWETVWVAFYTSCTTKGVGHVYLHSSSTCMATQGGAVSQFLWLFSPFLQDNKERLYFFRFCFVETSGQRDFKQLPNDSLRSICPWIMVLWLQVFVLWQLVRWKWQESVLSGKISPRFLKSTLIHVVWIYWCFYTYLLDKKQYQFGRQTIMPT